ncbi:DUF108 domain-containing protein [Rhodococcus rhodnii]|nr:aspartate dehydrogenase domain-containing protein [Rhodococcus rhodnii]TXG92294.1 DUF108 domain-containing protein [Rhodococcus rhodnii]
MTTNHVTTNHVTTNPVTTTAPAPEHRPRVRVAVLGYGSIGTVVARRLAAGELAGAELAAVVTRSPVDGAPAPVLDLDDALDVADVVVECAGQGAVRENGRKILEAGCDLVISSVGALCDAEFAAALRASGPGRAVCTNGAVGGLDLLAAAQDAAPFDSVLVRSTKRPAALVQEWMDEAEARRVRDTSEPVLVFRGSPADAARLFPKSLNVAAAVDFAVGPASPVSVELYADPAAELTRHEVEATGPVGHYTIRIENLPSAANPRTSAVVPYSILRTLAGLTPRPNLIA